MDKRTSQNQIWSPPQRHPLAKRVIFGLLLGAATGSAIGSACGSWYGGVAGMDIGALWGGMTGWTAYRVRHILSKWSNGPRVTAVAVVWAAGVVVAGINAVALALIGDTREFWSAPLPICGTPFLLLVLVIFSELMRVENGDFFLEERTSEPIDLSCPGAHHVSRAVRKLWSLVLLLTIRDKADEVHLEPWKKENPLRYRLGGVSVDLVPPPAHILNDLIGEIRGMAGLATNSFLVKRLLRRLLFLSPGRAQEGVMPVRVGEVILDVHISIHPTRAGERVVLRIPDHSLTAAQVQDALKEAMTKQPVPDTGIRHVFQGRGNCALACVAMLGGVSYEEVTADRCARGALTLAKIRALLKRFTGVRWQHAALFFTPHRLNQIRFPDWPVIVIIRPVWRWFQSRHCIIVKGEFVHDPNGTQAVRLDEYEKGHWLAVFILQRIDVPL